MRTEKIAKQFTDTKSLDKMYKLNNCFICYNLTLITKTQTLDYTLNSD